MKNTKIFIAIVFLLCNTTVFSDEPAPMFDWSVLWSGAWYPTSESETHQKGNLYNRGEIKINLLPVGLTLRGQVLNRQPLLFDSKSDVNWFALQDQNKTVINFQGGIYHSGTKSKLLFGIIDEWGLPARIRNPWVRSPPYADNRNSTGADLKTSPSSTKNDELYFFLSAPQLKKISGFVSAQTEVFPDSEIEKYRQTSASAGIKFNLEEKSILAAETFFTGALLKPKNSNTWFSNPPPQPERNFKLYAGNLFFGSPLISINSDFALSETFAWGTDIYANLSFTLSPKIGKTRIQRPLTISLAADGAGNRFTGRDGSNIDSGFRCAAKIEFARSRNSLLKFNTILKSPGISFSNINNLSMENFNQLKTNFYYRFPTSNNQDYIFKITRFSISYDRDAGDPSKIQDKIYGYAGCQFNLNKIELKNPIGFELSSGLTNINNITDNFNLSGEITYSPGIYQFKTQFGYEKNSKNEEIWDFSVSSAVRYKNGRFSLKIASTELPKIWNFGFSWRLDIR